MGAQLGDGLRGLRALFVSAVHGSHGHPVTQQVVLCGEFVDGADGLMQLIAVLRLGSGRGRSGLLLRGCGFGNGSGLLVLG